MTSGEKNSANFKLNDIVGETATGKFASEGYVITTGLPYLAGVSCFTFSLSTTKIDFGDLTPNHPAVQSAQIIVQNGLNHGYEVFAGELKPLTSQGQATIPDTSCDSDKTACTPAKALPWTRSDRFGFGFGMVGKGITVDFADSSYFRPFANLAKSETPAIIMESQAHKITHQATINYKVNVSSSEPVGQYQNTISFIAVPGF